MIGTLPSFDVALVLRVGGDVVYSHGDVDREFPLASVTKPIVAWSVLVAVDRGLVSLDDPAGPEGATVRHLLAHASGLPFEGR
ncbi:MAG: serine hydrolase domain-containing protein, partial [Actinomyces sp.]|nr:serine hydrolase domain-containing protein [Actinomyces sp.]